MTHSIEHQMTEIYCFVDDYFRRHPRCAAWRRSPHRRPRFSDAEVITVALSQGAFGCATLKRTYLLVAANWRRAFPHLPSYAEWLRRLHQLTTHTGLLLEASGAHDAAQALYLVDSKPIALCHRLRHGHVRLLREDGARFGKTSKGWFFGFKLHALRHISGRFVNVVLTPAPVDDRVPLVVLGEAADGGVVIGDLGYSGRPAQTIMADEAEALLITRRDVADGDERRRYVLSRVRQSIETGFSQLCNQFIDRVLSRSWGGLWNTIKLKVLFYNLRHAGVVSA